jgi:hypothetical protein
LWGDLSASASSIDPARITLIDVSISHDNVTVRPEPVEACPELGEGGISEWAQGFDKALLSEVEGLSPNGSR